MEKLTPKQREYLTNQALAFDTRNDFWKAYAQE
jgi:hypothetical protein